MLAVPATVFEIVATTYMFCTLILAMRNTNASGSSTPVILFEVKAEDFLAIAEILCACDNRLQLSTDFPNAVDQVDSPDSHHQYPALDSFIRRGALKRDSCTRKHRVPGDSVYRIGEFRMESRVVANEGFVASLCPGLVRTVIARSRAGLRNQPPRTIAPLAHGLPHEWRFVRNLCSLC